MDPLTCKLLFNSIGELYYIDLFRGKDAEEEWSLLIILVFDFCIRDNDIVDILLVMNRRQPGGLGDFTLLESLASLGSLKNDVVTINLPEAISS